MTNLTAVCYSTMAAAAAATTATTAETSHQQSILTNTTTISTNNNSNNNSNNNILISDHSSSAPPSSSPRDSVSGSSLLPPLAVVTSQTWTKLWLLLPHVILGVVILLLLFLDFLLYRRRARLAVLSLEEKKEVQLEFPKRPIGSVYRNVCTAPETARKEKKVVKPTTPLPGFMGILSAAVAQVECPRTDKAVEEDVTSSDSATGLLPSSEATQSRKALRIAETRECTAADISFDHNGTSSGSGKALSLPLQELETERPASKRRTSELKCAEIVFDPSSPTPPSDVGSDQTPFFEEHTENVISTPAENKPRLIQEKLQRNSTNNLTYSTDPLTMSDDLNEPQPEFILDEAQQEPDLKSTQRKKKKKLAERLKPSTNTCIVKPCSPSPSSPLVGTPEEDCGPGSDGPAGRPPGFQRRLERRGSLRALPPLRGATEGSATGVVLDQKDDMILSALIGETDAEDLPVAC